MTTFSYYPDGKRQRVTNVNGTYADYVYDDDRRLVSVSNHDAGNTMLSHHYYYLDAVGNRTRVDEIIAVAPYANGSPWTLPSAGGRPMTGAGGTPNSLPGARLSGPPGPSAAPLPTGRVDAITNSTTTYSYDRLYRLTGESGPAGQLGYAYD